MEPLYKLLLPYLTMDLLKVVGATAIVCIFVAAAWFVVWKLILGKIPIFREVLGFDVVKKKRRRKRGSHFKYPEELHGAKGD